MKTRSRIKTNRRKSSLRRSKKAPKLSLLKFFPALLILVLSLFIQLSPTLASAGHDEVLGYATSTNVSGLLSGTNSQRAANGVAALSLNSALNSAAQSKANDMVTRDYWSHNTPDGQEPWVFFTQAGYNYKAAGENLAYGFATSSDTITGWMNSPPHRDNLLKTSFYDVGFGIANSPNYVGTGEQTVVVAMYGALQSASAPTVAPASSTPPPPATAQPTPAKTTAQTPAASPVTAEPVETVPVAEPAPEANPDNTQANNPPVAATASPVKVRRIQLLTGGNATWSATLLAVSTCSVGLLWVLHRGMRFKKLFLNGERFVLHHIHLDFTVLAVIVLGLSLLGTSGVIR